MIIDAKKAEAVEQNQKWIDGEKFDTIIISKAQFQQFKEEFLNHLKRCNIRSSKKIQKPTRSISSIVNMKPSKNKASASICVDGVNYRQMWNTQGSV